MTGYKQLFEDIQRHEPGTPAYALKQDEIYRRARTDRRVDAAAVVQVSDYLFEGEVGNAENFLENALNQEGQQNRF